MSHNLYDIVKNSRNCIDKYLNSYNVTLNTCEENSLFGQIKGEMTLSEHGKKFGSLQYRFQEGELDIEMSDISYKGDKIKVKFMKILLLYLMSLYINKGVTIVKIKADPSYGQSTNKDDERKGHEYGLMCYYQDELGFQPYYDDEFIDEVNLLIEKCKRYIKDENISTMCLLKKCQRLTKMSHKFKKYLLKVDMKQTPKKIVKSLHDAMKDMNCMTS